MSNTVLWTGVALFFAACSSPSGNPDGREAAGGGSGGGAAGGGTGGSFTVAGTVVTEAGVGVANANVGIGGQWTTTDTSGHFSISNVTTPYDLITVFTSPSKAGLVYKGLTRADPTIVEPGPSMDTLHTAKVHGSLTGGNSLGSSSTVTNVAFGSPESMANTTNVTSNPFELTVRWPGPSTTTGTMHALQYTAGVTGLPAAFTGYGERANVSTTSSATTDGQDLVMSAVTSGNLSGTITLPAFGQLQQKSAYAMLADGAGFWIGSDATSSPAFNYLTPASIGATMSVIVTTTGLNNSTSSLTVNGLTANAASVSVNIQAPPAQAQPAAGGTGVTTNTDFTWTQFSGGVHLVAFTPANSMNPKFWVVTTGTTAKIPDLSAQGLGLPTGGATYAWSVYAFAPFASSDAFASASVPQLPQKGWLTSSGTYGAGSSGSRNFTTQ